MALISILLHDVYRLPTACIAPLSHTATCYNGDASQKFQIPAQSHYDAVSYTKIILDDNSRNIQNSK